jgi:hypothetical protein
MCEVQQELHVKYESFWAITDENEVRPRRVLRRIFAPKREEVAGGWRRLHNEELHNLCASPKY